MRLLLPKLLDIVEHHLPGTRFGIGVDPADGLLHPGRGGLSAHLDGREGGRLGRHAAARQGRRDQRPLVQRAAAPGVAGSAEEGQTRKDGRSSSRAGRSGLRASFNRRFWFDEGGYLYDVVDGEGGNDPACRPEPDLRHLASSSRARTETGGRRSSRWSASAC